MTRLKTMAEYYRDLPPANPDFEHQRFHSRIIYFTLIVFAVYTPIVLICMVLMLAALGMTQMTAGMIVATLVGAFIYTAVFGVFYYIYDLCVPVRIGPAGLCSYNGFGVNTRVPWKDIRGLKKVPFAPGMSFLLVRDKRSIFTAAWIPSYLAEPDRFIQEVEKYAGFDHPAARDFRKMLGRS